MSSQSEKFVCFRLEYITVWSRFLPPGNINLSWRKCKRKRACFAKVRNFGEALTNVAIHALLRELFLLASAVPAQFRIRSILLSAVAEWKETESPLLTCKHDAGPLCSFRTACCFVKFIIFFLLLYPGNESNRGGVGIGYIRTVFRYHRMSDLI